MARPCASNEVMGAAADADEKVGVAESNEPPAWLWLGGYMACSGSCGTCGGGDEKLNDDEAPDGIPFAPAMSAERGGDLTAAA